MDMFNAHRRDILNFDNYMDLKKPGFGGPNSAIAQRDAKGNKVNKDPKLDGYTRVIDRHSAFSHPVADPTYKAFTNDLVYKQEKKKPFNYSTVTGIPVVKVGETNEGLAFSSFTSFINEDAMNSEIEQLKADLEAYETENEEEAFEDEFGGNAEARWQDSDGDGEWYEEGDDVSAGANAYDTDNGPAYRGPEGYDDATDSYVDDEFGANPLDEPVPAELEGWLASLHGEEADSDMPAEEFGANPFEEEEDYYGEEYDEPLYGPDEEDPNN